jgi:hypothetical protein
MYKAIMPAIAMMLAVSPQPALAGDLPLSCKLRSGNQMTLAIRGNEVLKDGQAIKNLDPASVTVAADHIAFNQSFRTYDNAWHIDRRTLQLTFKTILKADSRAVLEEKGSCVTPVTASAPPRKKPKPVRPASLSDRIAAMLQR